MSAPKPTRPASRPAAARSGSTARAGSTAADRRTKAQALRNAEIRRARRRRLLIGAVALVVVAAVVLAIVLYVTSRSSSDGASGASSQRLPASVTSSDGPAVTQKAAVPVTDDSGIDGVLAWNTAGYPATTGDQATALEHDHVTGPVTYTVTPPVGGPHNAVWMNAGVYTDPVPNERGVHDMEHGAVWITYRPGLAADQVAALTAFAGKQSMIAEQSESAVSGQQNRYVVMSPWVDDSLPAPIVISSWGHQLRVDSASDPRLQRFVDTFRHNQKYTPEFGAAVDGIPTDTGGVPASFGSLKPNPSGSVPAGS